MTHDGIETGTSRIKNLNHSTGPSIQTVKTDFFSNFDQRYDLDYENRHVHILASDTSSSCLVQDVQDVNSSIPCWQAQSHAPTEGYICINNDGDLDRREVM